MDGFVDQLLDRACELVKHAKRDGLETKDLNYVLEKFWDIVVPGYGEPIPAPDPVQEALPSQAAPAEAPKPAAKPPKGAAPAVRKTTNVRVRIVKKEPKKGKKAIDVIVIDD